MDYNKFEMGSYNLHVIKTSNFKTVITEVYFRRKIVKDEILKRNMLKEVLLKSTDTYKEEKLLLRYLDELYDAQVGSKNARIGKVSTLSFTIKFLHEKYTEKGMNKKSIMFLLDLLFKPNITNNGFNEKILNNCKTKINQDILSLKDEKTKYTLIKLTENMDLKEASFNPYGYIEGIDDITTSNLYEYYKEVLNNDLIDVFVVGDVDPREIKKIFKDNFKVISFKKENKDIILEGRPARKRIKKIIQNEEVNQSKLALGCLVENMTDYERKYVNQIFNEIFGGDNGMLFNNLREKHSLCYYVYSVSRTLDNLIMIYSGIDKKNIDKSLKLIKKTLDNIVKGKFDDEIINNAKETILSSIKTLEGKQSGIIDNYYSKELINSDLFDVKKEYISNVKKEEITTLAKKVHFDTLFLLESGAENERD